MSSLVPRKLISLQVSIVMQFSLYLVIGILINLYIYRIKQLFDTADFSYTLPSHRLTVYIIGIFMGYLLRYLPKDYKINKVSKHIYDLRV